LKKSVYTRIEKYLYRSAKRHWRILVGVTIFLIFFEMYELTRKSESLLDPFHFIELAIYILILGVVGFLMNFLIEAHAAQDRTLEVLNYKHQTSLDLTKPEDWNHLTNKLVMIPSTIAAVEASRLFVRDLISGEYELLGSWQAEGANEAGFCYDWQGCLSEGEHPAFVLSPCHRAASPPNTTCPSREYCFPIIYAGLSLAQISFKLREGATLLPRQMEIFENIMPEMASALKIIQEQKRLAELQQAETALAERHAISAYLHDSLSQNLAYMCLKLDQLSTDHEIGSVVHLRSDLERVKDTANQSYDIVRNMVETTHARTKPRLVNLLTEYARKISQRANFEVSIRAEGAPLPLRTEVQQVIFYLFQEAISNIEKHSGAKHASVLIEWQKDDLVVTVSDDGTGFNPQAVDKSKHFGMDIMQERIAKIHGSLEVTSSPDEGTTVRLCVPLTSP
jgi:signal transduction histidine kinase